MLKDQIFTARPRVSEAHEVPEWGSTVHVARMNAAERDAMDGESLKLTAAGKSPIDNYRARTLVRALRDADGGRIFEDADAERLGQEDSHVLGRLYDVAKRLNGLDVEENAGKKKRANASA